MGLGHPYIFSQAFSASTSMAGHMQASCEAWTRPDHVEWHLIRGIVPLESHPADLCYKVVVGEFSDVLKSRAARPLIEAIARVVQASVQGKKSLDQVIIPFESVHLPVSESPLDALCVAIAALHGFVQLNWTGPNMPLHPVDLLRYHAPKYMDQRSVHDEDSSDPAYARLLHASSLEYLTLQGEPAYHLCQSPFFLVVALLILDALKASKLATVPWWRLRARSVHIRILDEPVACEEVLQEAVIAMTHALSQRSREALTEAEQHVWLYLHARALLENALAKQRAGQDRLASEGLVEAAKVHRLEYELSGALGKRTKWQKQDKTQLVLLAESREAGAERAEEDEASTSGKHDHDLGSDASGWQASIDPSKQVDHQPATYSLNDDTLLEQTQFTKTTPDTGRRLSHLDPGNQPPLAVMDQCILLALCLNIHNTQPSHGLTSEQMSAFVERVIQHPLNWSVHTMSLLLRSRLEASRTRTVERSTLQLQALVDQMPTNDSSVRERLRFFHALELPAKWAMQSELAHRYVSIGVLRSALETFERIEMWEDVVQCLGLLGRQQEGIEVVRDLLEGRKTEAGAQLQAKRIATSKSRVPHTRFARAREAKLWCLLGDLEPMYAEMHYLRAWDVSERSSARAARSLGGYHFALHAYEQASVWLRRAVRINALYTRSWFMLGCCYMRLEHWLEAAAAFRKCTALEEEDGESWNNLASCYMRLHQSHIRRLDTVLEQDVDQENDAESVTSGTDSGVDVMSHETHTEATAPVLELRLLAHRALAVSLKFQFESWRVWANYMIVSVDVGMLREAARALARVVEIRTREKSFSASDKAVDVQDMVDMGVLNKLVDAVIRPANIDEEEKNEGAGLRPTVERLFEQTLLPRFSTDAPIWQSYARLMFACGHYRKMLHARMQAFQCGLGNADRLDVVTARDLWLLAKDELQDLCDVLANLATRPAEPGSDEEAMPDWRFRARTLVRAFMSRTRDSFEDEPAWEDLVACMDDLKR